MGQPLRLAERSDEVFLQGLVVVRSTRIDLVMTFVVVLEQVRPPRHHVHAEGPRVVLTLTSPKRSCVLDANRDAALPGGYRYNIHGGACGCGVWTPTPPFDKTACGYWGHPLGSQ